MTAMLELRQVSKTLRDGPRDIAVLRDIELVLERGEYAVVWGPRGSGRSTLLRIAAGIEAPDCGSVRFEGCEVCGRGGELAAGIGYCHLRFGHGEGRGALDSVIMPLLAAGVAPARARTRAEAALERCGALAVRRHPVTGLERAEAVRVALARTIATEPRLVVIDDPTQGVELMQRDGVLLLLRTLASEGISVLACTGEPTGLSGADRTLALSEGRLRGGSAVATEPATVVPLRRAVG